MVEMHNQGFWRRLRKDTNGNAMMLTAMAAPAIFGAAGLGIDVAQYYLFQRELQYAVDQAAIAGAWARGNGDSGTYYQTRALQEFNANLSTTSGYSPSVTYAVADYDGKTQNSVVITAAITTNLPFTNFVLGRPTVVAVDAQASFEDLESYTPCLYALNPSASKALWFNGDPTVDAACGVGARSNASDAVRTNGSSGPQNITFAISGGGVSDGMGAFTNSDVVENLEDLVDPFDGVSPPDNATPRSLSCGSTSANWTADETATETSVYRYYQGQSAGKAESSGVINYADAQSPTTTVVTTLNMSFSTEPNNYTSAQTSSGLYKKAGNGPDTIWEEKLSTTDYAYVNKVQTAVNAGAMLPGTYSDFEISCDTVLAGGIYVIDGGPLKVTGNSLTGTGVMFVLKNGAELQITGGTINLTPMSSTELIAAGVSADLADKIEGILIFEDPNSPGSSNSKITGNANVDLNGIIYLPKSDLQLAGTMRASSECLSIFSNTLQLSGTTDLTTLCPPGAKHDVVVGGGGTRVRLVA
ncbi:TadE/TadG family type IV pilus assembly protein [Erythrobacter mangrovi]|uniref:Pilus assembly protein n=1 Tax=Erythrobacter mangrovi TaxID=2739433 RepID=A0A7D3XI77_9SPHN|nr:TadE/TadG family type IV pilus assembly protein [Erythrobacter mangrovi]QKG71618.1 pilus assembly protein [Erythrobacter mangrovi]